MTNRLSIISFFVLATLLAIGGVELFYHALNRALIVENQASTNETSGSAPGISGTTTSASVKTAKLAGNGKDYTIIAKRALFGKIKLEKKETTPAPTPVLETTSLDLTLLGTISGGSNEQRAIIQDKRKKTQDIYYQGDAIGPALIKEILRGKVILTVKGKDEILLMEEPKSPPSREKTALSPPTVSDYVAEEPEPIEEEIIEAEVLTEETEPEQDTLNTGDETESSLEEQDQRPGPSAPPRPPRRVSFKKNKNQVVEP